MTINYYPLFCSAPISPITNNSFNPTITGPFINVSGASSSGALSNFQFSINQITSCFIYDNSAASSTGTTPTNYFKGTSSFMLLTGILDTAPSANVAQPQGGSIQQTPQITMQISNLTGGSNWIIVMTLSAGGKMATTPFFQTTATGSSASGFLTFILTNFFSITVPGIIYTVSIEGFSLLNNSLTPVTATTG